MLRHLYEGSAVGTVYDGEAFDSWSETEFFDFELFLRVCDELKIESLIIIEPVNGYFYGMQKYTKESRRALNDCARQMVDAAEVEYLDLSGYEYGKYWLCDVMHLSWKS